MSRSTPNLLFFITILIAAVVELHGFILRPPQSFQKTLTPRRSEQSVLQSCVGKPEHPVRGITPTAVSSRREWIKLALGTLIGSSAAGFLQSPAVAASLLATVTKSSGDVSKPSFVSICDPNVSSWKNAKQGRVIHLVGTAHISSESADLAAKVVREVKPDCLFVELDLERIDRAFRGGRPMAGLKLAVWDKQGNLRVGVTKSDGREPNPLIKWLMGKGTSQVLAGQGFLAGEEFVASVEEAAKCDALVVLGDRGFTTSMRRLAEASSKTDVRMILEADKAMTEMLKREMPEITQWSRRKRPSKEDVQNFIENMKNQKTVDKMMGIFKNYAPEIYSAMVTERDGYLSLGLNALEPFPTTVAVMGLAHVSGVSKNLKALGWKRIQNTC